MQAHELKVGDTFSFSTRKNAKRYTLKICEVVSGDSWSRYPELFGQIFLMGGECLTRGAFQMMIDPDTEVWKQTN